MPGEYKEDKTEKATPRQRQRAREQGNVAQSQEVGSVMVLIFGVLSLYFFSSYMCERLRGVLQKYLSGIGQYEISRQSFSGGLGEAMLGALVIVAPVMIALVIVSMASSYMQFGFLFSTKALKPRFSAIKPSLKKLNPLSKEKLVDLGVNGLKLAIVSYVAYRSIRAEIPDMLKLTDMPVESIFGFTAMLIFRLVMKIAALFIIAAIADYLFRKYKYEESIRMTKQQVKDERKDIEGDPHVKGKIRSIQIKTAMQRMMKDVPKADVVITNPTHYAIALKYDKEMMWAPKVVAKGARLVAQKIKEIAKENGVPMVENKPLAQALFKVCEVGKYIPAAFYHAVAEILAYIYSLNHNKKWV